MKYIAYILLLGCLGEGEASQGSIREAPAQLPPEDNLQNATQSASDYSESTTTVTQKAISMREETPAAPLMKKNGMYFYDLAQAESTDVVLDDEKLLKYGLEVSGVSVSPGGHCRTKTLMLRVSLRMDPIVATACTSLTSITIIGIMHCRNILAWVQHFPKIITIQQVHCTDAQCYIPGSKSYRNYDPCKLEIIHGHPDFVSSMCPTMCYCTWYQKEEEYWLDVVCEDAHLNDSYLPKLPLNTKNLHLSYNQIRCLKNLLDHCKGLNKLKRIVLEKNQVSSIPPMPLHMFRQLEFIDISYNNIAELDVDVLRYLFTNKQVQLNLDGNPIRCGCNLYHVNHYYMNQCGDSGERRCIHAYGSLRCYSESENTTQPIWEMDNLENCVTEPLIINWWLLLNVVLCFLNIIMFWLIIDLLMIKRTKSSRRPKMDYMVGSLRHLRKLLRPERQEAQRQSENEMFELRDANIQLRRTNRCSTPTWRRSRYQDL